MSTLTLTLLFISASSTFKLPPDLLKSLCYVESGHKVEAIHYADGVGNSLGVCQIKLTTAKQLGFRGTEKQLMEPNTNIYYAAKYLAHQRDRYAGSIEKAVIAYNIGSAKHLQHTKYSARVIKEWKQQEVAVNEWR